MAGRPIKFPVPHDYPAKTPAVLCPADRVISLYNQDSGDIGQRIAKKMKAWFTGEAKKKGWAGCYFLPQVQSAHGAGCILLNPPSVTITMTSITLQISEKEEG